MATSIQLKRALTFEGTADEAMNESKEEMLLYQYSAIILVADAHIQHLTLRFTYANMKMQRCA